MSNPYRLTTLPNGLRIASITMPHMQSASVGLWVKVGGRYESAAQSGISHFTEHLLFKGTRRRTARKITEAVEGLGGYLNAFTTEDHTCYYAKASANHLPVLGDVLTDMYLYSQFAPVEIERERDVIGEEILMVRDNPSQYVQELLSETLWPDHPLGRSLTGTVETIARLRREDFLDFTRRHYHGRNTVVAVASRLSHDALVEEFAPRLGCLPPGRRPGFRATTPIRDDAPARLRLVNQEIEQTHLALGWETFGRRDERRFALKILSVLLGENMSSRLFQKLRERYGLCYCVQSCLVCLDDTGAFTLSAALDAANLEKAVRLIRRELERIIETPPSRREVRQAQDYTIGQTLMSLESTTNQMMWIGESLLGYGELTAPAELEKKLLAVTPEAVSAVARTCLKPGRLAVALTGENPGEERLRRWLEGA